MIYVICTILIWIVLSILFLTKVFSEPVQERPELPADGFMGVAHDVFQLKKEAGKDSILTGGNALSEEDFEVEYDSIEVDDEAMIDDGIDDSTQEGTVIGFEEMQQMVAVVEDDKLLSTFDSKGLGEIKQTIKQIEDTDFFEKMIKTKEDISRRIDEILNNIN
jgi:hypothetical protein